MPNEVLTFTTAGLAAIDREATSRGMTRKTFLATHVYDEEQSLRLNQVDARWNSLTLVEKEALLS